MMFVYKMKSTSSDNKLLPKMLVQKGSLPWAKCQIFLKALFICNNINKNLNKNFHTKLNYRSFKSLFLFFQISARSSWKKFENEKWPKAGYLPLCLKGLMECINEFRFVDSFHGIDFFIHSKG